jgi:hypothetical protein
MFKKNGHYFLVLSENHWSFKYDLKTEVPDELHQALAVLTRTITAKNHK